MKKTLAIFIVLVLQFSSVTVYSNNQSRTNERTVFKTESINLAIIEKPFELIARSSNGNLIYKNPQSFAFKIDGVWESIQNVISIDDKKQDQIIVKLKLSNNNLAELKIINSSKLLFRIEMTSDSENITDVKGVNRLFPVEEVYGFGEVWNGSVAQRGKAIDIWNDNGTPDECAYMPYYVSTQNYAFWLEYGGLVQFDVGKSNSTELSWELTTDKIVMNLFFGNSVAEAVQGFIKATGLPAKPPRWAYEPWAWLMHDPEQPGAHISTLKGVHAVDMVEKFKEMDIPVGVTWMEPPWQTERTSFIPNKKFDPDLEKTIKTLNEMGVKTLAWTVPYTTKDSPNWDEAVSNNFIVGMPGTQKTSGDIKVTRSGEIGGKTYNYIDFTNPEAVKWWQSEIEKAIDLGFVGFKLDAGQSLERDAILSDNKIGKDWHNSYSFYYNKTFYEILNKKLDDDFLMIPRAASIGTGQYTNFKWPGDLTTSFGKNGLSSSVFSTLSASLSGLPFLSTDIGGFGGLPAREEVWLRWAQFGAMLPGMQTLNMPWWYSEKAQEHYRYLSWLHTDLIPYWQSLGNLAAETGTPICRHLIWDYQDDMETWRIDNQFTVGENLLVAPIIEPNAISKVYLPKGRWFNFWDDSQIIDGGSWVKYFEGWTDHLLKFPLYIKEGAIIPFSVKNDISGFGWEQSAGYITMAIWPMENGTSSFTLLDEEDKVVFEVDDSIKHLVVKWDKSEKEYILRINYNQINDPEKIVSESKSSEGIKKFAKLQDFLSSKQDGWVFDSQIRKIIIRKSNCSEMNLIKIFK